VSDQRAMLVHSCDGCGGTLIFSPWEEDRLLRSNNTFGLYVFCRKCQEREDAKEAAQPAVPHARCAHRDLPAGPFSDLYVTAVEGDQVTVGVLGFNGLTPERVTALEEWAWPASMRGRRTFARAELRMRGL
jgi:hypothetical protein